MKTVSEMAREAGCIPRRHPEYDNDVQVFATPDVLERLVEIVRADEREGAYKRRGTLMFNPYTGTPRHPSDVASDPHGILMLDPEQPIRAARSNT